MFHRNALKGKAMRITSQMSQNKSMYYIGKNHTAYSRSNEKILAQRQLLNMSDNPSAAISGVRISTTIAKTQQYVTNIKSGVNSLKLTDSKLQSTKKLLDKMNEHIIGAANGTYDSTERQVMATELGDMLKSLMGLANSTDGERYIFGGTNTQKPPYSTVGSYVLWNGNNKTVDISTGTNSNTSISCTGTDAFGNATSTVSSDKLKTVLSTSTDVSTPISALNGGNGVALGKVTIAFSGYPNGLEVDLSRCDTVEDIKDVIEKATLEASRNLNPIDCDWLDGSNLDWKDLTDRYVQVTVNPDGTGLSLQEIDLGEPLPEPTLAERKAELNYSGAQGFPKWDYAAIPQTWETRPGYGIAEQDAAWTLPAPGDAYGKVVVFDKLNPSGNPFTSLSVDDYAGNKVATHLGIKGTANGVNGDPVLDGYLHGTDLNPAISKSTLLSDLVGYNDAVYTIRNGSKLNTISITETTSDPNGVFNNWNLANLAASYNTGPDGELYARVTKRGTAPDEDLYVEIYSVPLDKAKATDLVAVGEIGTDGGTVHLEEANGSGVSGSVGINPNSNLLTAHNASESVALNVNFGDGFTGVVDVPAFVEQTGVNGSSLDYMSILSGWNITGLSKPSGEGYANTSQPASTDLNGNMGVSLAYDDTIPGVTLTMTCPDTGDVIATGVLEVDGGLPSGVAQSGRIVITGAEGYEGISGSVYVEIPAGETVPPDYDFNLTATFATVEDLMRAVEESGTYTSLNISADGKSLEFNSNLAGAYLTVSEDHDCYEQMGDSYQQLSGLDLNGVVAGVNADSNGAVYSEIAYYPPDPARTDGKAVLLSEDGEQILIDAGYYVRMYSDASALDKDYKDRDNSTLVAEGFLPYDSLPAGSAASLELVAQNGSGLSGTVDLNYYGDRPVDTTLAQYDNSGITVTPGGIRPEHTTHTTIQEVDIPTFIPGVNCDYRGDSHGVVSYDGTDTTVALYRDSSHSHMAAKGVVSGQTGTVIFYETDKTGKYSVDMAKLAADGYTMVDFDGMSDAAKRDYYIQVGSMKLADNQLAAGQSDDFVLSSGGVGASGQERESNIFATILDAIDALNANDVEALHDLVGVFANDISRLMAAEGDVASRTSSMDLLSERYQDDIISYTTIFNSTVGMDTDSLAMVLMEFTAAQNAYDASLQVASSYLQLSLLDYL